MIPHTVPIRFSSARLQSPRMFARRLAGLTATRFLLSLALSLTTVAAANSAEPKVPEVGKSEVISQPGTSTTEVPQHVNSPDPSVRPEDERQFELPVELQKIVDPERFANSAQLVITMTLLGLIPAVLLMTTAYIRIAIVLSLLRQAFGAQLLPLQVTTALAMFCTGLIMWPTWQVVHERAVVPLISGVGTSELAMLCEEGIQPIREFMIRQIHASENSEDIHLFLRHLSVSEAYPTEYAEVPLRALLPAFVLSELKTAFLIGFQIYLPFLVIDLVIATVTTSMGMFMLPPHLVSLPLKLLVFVMVDGWRLVVEMLLNSFQ